MVCLAFGDRLDEVFDIFGESSINRNESGIKCCISIELLRAKYVLCTKHTVSIALCDILHLPRRYWIVFVVEVEFSLGRKNI